MNILKVLAIMIVCLAVANAVFFALGKISALLFWTTIIVCAIIAYWVIPRIRKSTQDIPAIK